MKITIESTTKIIHVRTREDAGSHGIPARIWEGETENGIKIHCFVTRIAVAKNEDTSQFEKELQEHNPPTVEIESYPLRMVL